jgi:hypothetical protein
VPAAAHAAIRSIGGHERPGIPAVDLVNKIVALIT